MITATQLNALTGPVIIILVVVLAAAMLLRVARHLRAGRRTPLLLKRDLLLFGTLAVLLLGGQFGRWTGVRLGEEILWVILTNSLAFLTLGVWLAIEVGVIGRARPAEQLTCPHCGGAL